MALAFLFQEKGPWILNEEARALHRAASTISVPTSHAPLETLQINAKANIGLEEL